jgi:hypothetical protein
MNIKRGRLSKAEQDLILRWSDTMKPDDIAVKLKRTVECVTEFLRLHAPETMREIDESEAKKLVIRQELRLSEAWKMLRNEFSNEEIKYFEETYVKLMSQFKDDVLPSEETQLFQAIKYELLMARNLKERRRARDEIDRLERVLRDHLEQFAEDHNAMDESDREYATNLENQLNAYRSAEQSRTNEYVKLQERHESLMKSLKAIRDQRIKEIEGSKTNLISIIKMLQQRDAKAREGREMELMRLAGQKAHENFGKPFKYEDNSEDLPILSADTLEYGEEE